MSSLHYTNMILHKRLGVRSRQFLAHVPSLHNRRILEELEEVFAAEVDKTSSHRFRNPEDMQFQLTYFSWVREYGEPYNPEAILTRFDLDQDGKLDESEFGVMLSYMKLLLKPAQTATALQKVLYACLEPCQKEASRVRTTCLEAFIACQPDLEKLIFRKLMPKY